MANSNLTNAKKAKNDEFYTQYLDIEKEVNAYLEYNPDVFKGKTILLPCDDPEWSSFTRFFAKNFKKLKLKKLVSTSYAEESKNLKSGYNASFFEKESPEYDKNKTKKNGKIFTLTRDRSGDGKIDVDDLEWEYLKGDGDFRSDEIKKLRDEADVIITNPPFSLFRPFLGWIMEAKKQFLIIGTLNAITYKEVFPLLKENKIWLGNNYKINGGAMFYEIPESIANLAQVREIKTNKNGQKVYITRVQGVRWFTNLEHGRLHQPLQLMTEAEVVRFVTKKPFEKYDNYGAIEVSLVKNIPKDYKGVMGVPISFLDKYSPEQFEIVGATESEGKGFSEGLWDETSKVSQPLVGNERVYKRIFIRHKKKTK